MEDFPQHYLKRFMSNTSELLIIVTTILSFKRYNMCHTNHTPYTHSTVTIIMNLIRKERQKEIRFITKFFIIALFYLIRSFVELFKDFNLQYFKVTEV